jgi:hypothetical protein
MMQRRFFSGFLIVSLAACTWPARAEGPLVKYGDPVPRDVREIYDAGLRHLLKTQGASGEWKSQHGSPAPTAMGLMVLLASGEDPNFGPYRGPIRRALRAIINEQDAAVGYIGGEGGRPSMYHHGFAMLGLAEAYGVVDDRGLWSEAGAQAGKGQGRSIGKALELAVRAAVTAHKKNPTGGWHYGPDMPSADTSVSGAVLMGLLAARNCGIEVPDETIDRAIKYYVSMTGGNGNVGYSGSPGNGTQATTSIGVLVFSIARRQALPQYKQATDFLEKSSTGAPVASGGPGRGVRADGSSYEHYYRAQALFQCNVTAWEQWNAGLVKTLKAAQAKDGSFSMSYGREVDTPLTLLALAVNYKFLPVYER